MARSPLLLPQGMIAAAGVVPLLVDLLRSPKDQSRKAAASGGWMDDWEDASMRLHLRLCLGVMLLSWVLLCVQLGRWSAGGCSNYMPASCSKSEG